MITPINVQNNEYQKQDLSLSEQKGQNFKVQSPVQSPAQSFKGGGVALSTAFNFLNTSPSLGAIFVDVAFMDTPRTVVDTFRSPDAGLETGIRDFGSTANHTAAGIFGAFAGLLIAQGINRANGVKAHSMFMNSDTIDTLSSIVKETNANKAENGFNYFKKMLEQTQYFDPKTQQWEDFPKQLRKDVATALNNVGTEKQKLPSNVLNEMYAKTVAETGAGEQFRIKEITTAKEIKHAEGSAKDIFNKGYSMRKAAVDKATNGAKNISWEEFIKQLKSVKTATAVAGLSIPIAIGMVWQPFNAYLTKKRTGKEGFVGVEGREPDKSAGFKLLKTGIGTAVVAGLLSTISRKPKDILPKLQFKGLIPTIDQFKMIYGVTIFSRILASRDKNELREVTIKDTLGFANWLILGGFVSKLTANALSKKMVNYDKNNGKGNWNWITKAVEKTHEEILYPALKEADIKTVDAAGKPVKFSKLMKQLAQKAKETNADQSIKDAVKHIKYKNIAMAAGFAYSGLVLGIGIPKLNIAITNRVEKKRKAKEASSAPNKQTAQEQPAIQQQKVVTAFAQNSNGNKAFSSFFGAM